MATVSLQSLLLCAAAVLVLSTSVLASRALQASHDDHEAAQALRVFLPQWMSHSRLHGGSLRWKENSPSGEMYGQDEEDIAADKKYFHDMHNGIFLEMGALDGKTFSNTKFFEETRGWRGLLIEPNPEEFVKLQAERPNAISVNAAICDKKQDVHFVGRRSSESAGNCPCSAFSCEYLYECIDESLAIAEALQMKRSIECWWSLTRCV